MIFKIKRVGILWVCIKMGHRFLGNKKIEFQKIRDLRIRDNEEVHINVCFFSSRSASGDFDG